MSAFPDWDIDMQGVSRRELSPVRSAVVGTVPAVLGSATTVYLAQEKAVMSRGWCAAWLRATSFTWAIGKP
jgi:hypothetical protein